MFWSHPPRNGGGFAGHLRSRALTSRFSYLGLAASSPCHADYLFASPERGGQVDSRMGCRIGAERSFRSESARLRFHRRRGAHLVFHSCVQSFHTRLRRGPPSTPNSHDVYGAVAKTKRRGRPELGDGSGSRRDSAHRPPPHAAEQEETQDPEQRGGPSLSDLQSKRRAHQSANGEDPPRPNKSESSSFCVEKHLPSLSQTQHSIISEHRQQPVE